MTEKFSLGFSPCPNDTFIFYALVHNHIASGRPGFSAPVLEDVETLNQWAMTAQLDVTKLSFHALGHLPHSYTMLSAGAALGRGCGPLLVTRRQGNTVTTDPIQWRIAIPGKFTTAALLLKLFLPEHATPVVMRFDTIVNAVASGEVDGGVIIHESRFTYQDHGLCCVQDLGQWWEAETGYPLPLGCIAARSSFGPGQLRGIGQAIADSISWAQSHPRQCGAYIKEHARELDDEVIASHIALYVNDFSIDLGREGRCAVQELLARGRQVGALPRLPVEQG